MLMCMCEEITKPSGAPAFNPVFSGVRVTRFLALCVCLVNRCLENIFLIYLLRITDSFLYIRKAACYFLQLL